MIRRLRTLAFALAVAALVATGALAQSFTFIHISDTHITGSGNNVKNLTAIAAEVNAMQPQPAFALVTGDQTETGLTRDWERYAEVIKAFRMPIYNVAGNHETKWSHWGEFGLHKFLNQEPRYSFTQGGVHFVAMDSTVWLQHHGLIDKSELTWLAGDLAKAGLNTPSVLFYHHCPGFIRNEPELLRAIRPYNVRLILVGHGHNFKTWKRNGLLFQECKGAMNNEGGYRILEVSDTQIRSLTKLVGKSATIDATIPLAKSLNPVNLTWPRFDEKVEGSLHISARVSGGVPGRTVEYAIDDKASPMTTKANGVYDADAKVDGTPGWHTISVKATDPDGTEWSDSVPVRVDGASREAWRVRVSGGVQRGIRAVGDRLYFGTLGGDAYCLDARTGGQIWRLSVGSDVISEVAVQGSLACFGTTDGRVFGVDSATGKRKWEFPTGGPILGSPAIGDGQVLIGSGEPAYYAIDAVSGKRRWRFAMDRATQVVPIQLNDAVLFGAWDKNFYALDSKTGNERWKTPIGVSFYYSTANSDPATNGERIVVNVTPYKPQDHDIYCLDAKTGQILWSRRNPGKSDCGFNSPCANGDRFYTLSGNGEVFCMSFADGKEIWRGNAGISIVSGKPAFADGKLYVTGLRGNIACLDAANGKALWSYSTGEGYLFGGETVWRDLVIVPSTGGTVTAIRR